MGSALAAIVRTGIALGMDRTHPLIEALMRLDEGGGGGSGGGIVFPNRYDLSVNSGRVEGAASSEASLITLTAGNVAGGFNAGGVGNKAILGFKGHDQLPLASLQSLQLDYELVSLSMPASRLYINLIVDIGAGVLKVFVIDPTTSPKLFPGTTTPLGGNKFRFLHVTATDYVQVVAPAVPLNDFVAPPYGTGTVPYGASTTANPPAPGTPAATNTFVSISYRYSDILAAHPASKLVDAFTADGGLPKLAITPALMVLAGDSSNNTNGVVRVSNVLLNGAPA